MSNSFCLILFINYLCIINYYHVSTNVASSGDECFLSNLITGETWKRVWQDEFESDQLSNWKIDHELGDKCRESCQRQENAWTTNDLLVMMAKQENNANFTAAAITTEQYFAYGRYEIRARVPIGDHISVVFYTRNDKDNYWPESGQIYIMASNVQYDTQVLYNPRGFYPNGNRQDYIREENPKLKKDDNSFHRYGVEWNEDKIQFFFDENYGKTFFWNDTTNVKQWQKLRILIAVGKNADNIVSTKLDWKCPTFLIDYIRVYEKVELDYLKFNSKEIKSKQCEDKSKVQLDEQEMATEKICTEASFGRRFKSLAHKQQINYWIYTTIILLIIAIALIVYPFVPRNVSVNKTDAKQTSEYEIREYLEIVS